MTQIFLIEDDEALAEGISFALEREGYQISCFSTCRAGREAIAERQPDLVLLASDITTQADIRDVLENAGLACAFFQVDTFADYAFMMEQLCAVTGREDLYEENVTQVGQQIEEAQANAALSSTRPNVLLIRAFSTGIKAKTDDELAGAILKDLGAHNIADDHPSMLEDLSLEEVIAADPDYIFVTTIIKYCFI